MRCHSRFMFFVALLTVLVAPARAADLEQPVMLVAKPQLKDAFYGSTILLAKAIGNNQHVGFIINKPTSVTMGQAFPGYGSSENEADFVFLGGPANSNMIFALVNRQDSPGRGTIEFAPNIFLAIAAEAVARVIKTDADHARFLLGAVVWRPGELQDELRRGLWYVLEPEAELVLRKKTEGLWEELVRRSEVRANAI